MYNGKQEKLVLIKEIASTHALQAVDQPSAKLYKQRVLNLQRQRQLDAQVNEHIDEVLQQMEGETVSDMLDFLSKELVRLQEERRIHAFAMLAERQRRMREAEESGRREDDEIFKQMLKTQQDCVDTYLQDCILDTMERTADEQSRAEIQLMAAKINDIAYDIEETWESKFYFLLCVCLISNFMHNFFFVAADAPMSRARTLWPSWSMGF